MFMIYKWNKSIICPLPCLVPALSADIVVPLGVSLFHSVHVVPSNFPE